MAPPDRSQPITGLCIVTDLEQCPPGYEMIYRSQDKHEDCDLWKDGFFKSRSLRYLCVTRDFPLGRGQQNNVLVDIIVNNERDLPPTGYTLIERTQDTGERATQKKQICVRMIPRGSTNSAICDVIILSKLKCAPTEYTISGELNGLLLCHKMKPFASADTLAASLPYGAMQLSLGATNQVPSAVNNSVGSPVDEHRMTAVSGVPFQLSSCLQDKSGLGYSLPILSYRSRVDIDNEFSYSFRLERNTIRSVS